MAANATPGQQCTASSGRASVKSMRRMHDGLGSVSGHVNGSERCFSKLNPASPAGLRHVGKVLALAAQQRDLRNQTDQQVGAQNAVRRSSSALVWSLHSNSRWERGAARPNTPPLPGSSRWA